jgi:hypothetical protein
MKMAAIFKCKYVSRKCVNGSIWRRVVALQSASDAMREILPMKPKLKNMVICCTTSEMKGIIHEWVET